MWCGTGAVSHIRFAAMVRMLLWGSRTNRKDPFCSELRKSNVTGFLQKTPHPKGKHSCFPKHKVHLSKSGKTKCLAKIKLA